MGKKVKTPTMYLAKLRLFAAFDFAQKHSRDFPIRHRCGEGRDYIKQKGLGRDFEGEAKKKTRALSLHAG